MATELERMFSELELIDIAQQMFLLQMLKCRRRRLQGLSVCPSTEQVEGLPVQGLDAIPHTIAFDFK